MLSVCIPSRGLIYAPTITSTLSTRVPIYVKYGLPIPDCFNWFIDNIDGDLWFVEEDMGFSPNMLDQLDLLGTDIATADYNLPKGTAVQTHASGYMFGGTGCTLIRRHVFDEIGHFRTDTLWSAKELKEIKIDPSKRRVYGKHDVDFYLRAQIAGFSVGVVEEKAEHYRVDKEGKERDNNGCHTISKL